MNAPSVYIHVNMPVYEFIWSEGDEDEEGNLQHLAEHQVTPDEAAYVVEHPIGHESNRIGDPIAFGYTAAGRHLAVAYWFVDDITVYVETAYDTPPRVTRNRS